MNFNEARQEYNRLKRSYQEGLIGPDLFQKAVKNLIVVDEQGCGWQIGVNSGQWYRRDEVRGWVADEPEPLQESAVEPPETLDVLAVPAGPPEKLAESTSPVSAAPAQPPFDLRRIQLSQKAWIAILGAVILICMGCFVVFSGTAFFGGLFAANVFPFSNGEAPREPTPTATRTRTPTITLTPRPSRTPTGSPAPTKTPRASHTPGSTPTPVVTLLSSEPKEQWLLSRAENELWVSATDGGGMSLLETEEIVSPLDLSRAVSPQGGHIAYVTIDEEARTYSLKLKVVHIPGGDLVKEISLISPDFEEGEEEGERSPEAALAITEQEAVAWSPDGQQLAFIGVMEGNSADLYLYDLRYDSITRLSSEPSQAYAPSWSPDSRYIVYFGTEYFGLEGTYEMTGAWAARPNQSGGVIKLYEPDSGGEVLVGWSDLREFVVASYDVDCEFYNLRLVDVETQQTTEYYPGCHTNAALDPETKGVMLTVSDYLSTDCICQEDDTQAGIYLIPNGKGLARLVKEEDPLTVQWQPDARLFYVTNVDDEKSAFNTDEEEVALPEEVGAVYPEIAPVSGWWAWVMPPEDEQTGLWVGDTQDRALRKIFDDEVSLLLWNDDGQSLVFFSEELMYIAREPNFEPLAAAEFAAPVDQAVWVRP